MGQVPAGSVEEEGEYLGEEVNDRMPLGMLAHGAKEPVQMRVKLDPTQVSGKKMEPGPPSQAVGRDFNSIDATGTLELGLGHGQLHQLGDDNRAMTMKQFVIYFGQLKKNYCIGRGVNRSG